MDWVDVNECTLYNKRAVIAAPSLETKCRAVSDSARMTLGASGENTIRNTTPMPPHPTRESPIFLWPNLAGTTPIIVLTKTGV